MGTIVAHVEVSVPIFFLKDDGEVIAYSPMFRLYGIGNNDDSAVDNFKKHLKKFFEFHTKNKTLPYKMAALGWKPFRGNEMAPPDNIDIPAHLLGVKGNFRKERVSVPKYA